jgi:hypothetical protein
VLQELLVLLKAATELVEEIQVRFDRGDAAADLVASLVTQTTLIQRYIARLGAELPNECSLQFAKLIEGVQSAVGGGNTWLSRAAGPELATEVLRQRICKTYGLATRNN